MCTPLNCVLKSHDALNKQSPSYCSLISVLWFYYCSVLASKPLNSSLNAGVFCQPQNEELRRWLSRGSRVEAVGGYQSFYSTRWRKGFPSFQFQVKSSRSLTVIRLLGDIESQAESQRMITCWSEGQELQSSTARKFIFWISILAKGFSTDSGTMWLLFGFFEERTWTSATWWEISSVKRDLLTLHRGQREMNHNIVSRSTQPLCAVWSGGPLQVVQRRVWNAAAVCLRESWQDFPAWRMDIRSAASLLEDLLVSSACLWLLCQPIFSYTIPSVVHLTPISFLTFWAL